MPKSIQEKREEAEQRQKKYDSLPLEKKLEIALAKGHEGSKQVRRLREQIKEKNNNGK